MDVRHTWQPETFFGSSVLEKLMQTFLPRNDKKEADTRKVQFDLIKEGARIIKHKNM